MPIRLPLSGNNPNLQSLSLDFSRRKVKISVSLAPSPQSFCSKTSKSSSLLQRRIYEELLQNENADPSLGQKAVRKTALMLSSGAIQKESVSPRNIKQEPEAKGALASEMKQWLAILLIVAVSPVPMDCVKYITWQKFKTLITICIPENVVTKNDPTKITQCIWSGNGSIITLLLQ